MTKEKLNDILIRAGKTFAQAFVASFSIDAFIGVTDSGMLKKLALATLVGAVASGISAVWNAVLEVIINKIDGWTPTADELTEAIESEEAEEITTDEESEDNSNDV